ncbi:MAG: peptidylprolyl isomerase, partial [Pseudonocardiaceae bacterium]
MPTNEQRREAAKRKLDRQLARRAKRAKRRRTFAVLGSVAGVVLEVGLVVLITILGGGEEENSTDAEPSALPLPTSEPLAIPTVIAPPPARPEPLPASVDCQYPISPPPATPAKPVTPPSAGSTPTQGTQQVTLQSSEGAIELTLDRELAPCTVHSFLSLAQQGFYNDSPCHRLVTNPGLQVLQCGDPTGQGNGGPGYTIPDEVFPELTYGRGYV